MKEQIEEMGKLCPFYEEGKCNLLEDEAAECNFDCDMCDFARTLYNAGYRKQEWISVDDRLPTEQDADDDYGVLAIHKRSIKRYYHWKSVADNPFDFTHWMPLPEPPKMKGGAE